MGILSWLLRRTEPASPAWHVSATSNLTTLHNGYRVTVFRQCRGWKYVINGRDKDEEVVYSVTFPTQEEAKDAAIQKVMAPRLRRR